MTYEDLRFLTTLYAFVAWESEKAKLSIRAPHVRYWYRWACVCWRGWIAFSIVCIRPCCRVQHEQQFVAVFTFLKKARISFRDLSLVAVVWYNFCITSSVYYLPLFHSLLHNTLSCCSATVLSFASVLEENVATNNIQSIWFASRGESVNLKFFSLGSRHPLDWSLFGLNPGVFSCRSGQCVWTAARFSTGTYRFCSTPSGYWQQERRVSIAQSLLSWLIQ